MTTKGNGDAFISEERHTALSTGGGQAGQGYPAILAPICMATQQGGAEIRTDDKAPTVTAAAGMSGNNQPVVCMPIAFAQNQRDEIRDLGDKAGALQAQPGMKQQTFIIDSIGGQEESAKETDVAPTLKACHYKSPPSIAVSAGFCTEHSAKARGVGFEEETSPTLRAGVTPAVVYDARGNGAGDKVATITGGHESSISDYTNVVVEPVVYNGANITSPVNAANPQPGDPCHTLSTDSRNYCVASEPVYCLQGNGIDRADTAGCNGKGWKEDSSYTLNTVDRPAVAYGEPAKTNYIVRRLTPTECARLQGFPDTWGVPDKKEDFTDEEYSLWHEVRNTHAAINGKLVKDYTKAQMLTWYNKLHTDSAEYKMWGNGIALPTALYCMEGIAEALNEGK